MIIDVSARFSFFMPETIDILLQFEAAHIPEQTVLRANSLFSQTEHFARVAAQDAIGERIWIRAQGNFEVSYTAEVDVNRHLAEIATLGQLDPGYLPGETVQYLLPSLYCPAVRFQPFAEAEFGGTCGGERIEAIRDWIASRFTYTPGSSTNLTSALDSFVELRGICRDYAHVMIALARASGIPARYVSVFSPRVEPQDFHAVAEVFLADPSGQGGAWHLIDATGMAEPAEMVKIGVGRDAADVSFLSSFGECEFGQLYVSVSGGTGAN